MRDISTPIMNTKKQILLTLLVATLAGATASHAEELTAKDEFCSRSWDDFQTRSQETYNHVGFDNSNGGLFNFALCLWHSRFQRNASYLAVFRPELQKPTANEASKLIDQIYSKKKVVEIPGYSNLQEFSTDFAPEIKKRLKESQKFDGLVRQTWINTLTGKTETDPEKLKATLDDIYNEVMNLKRITYLKLKYTKFDIHAWLVVKMTVLPSPDEGYELDIIDSNFSGEILKRTYRMGDKSLDLGYEIGNQAAHLVPYVERQDEFKEYTKNIVKYCSGAKYHVIE